MSDEATTETFVRRLGELTDYDAEIAHIDADEVLLEALRELSHGAVADAYVAVRQRVGFWYA